MISFLKDEAQLFLAYQTGDDARWLAQRLDSGSPAKISKTFFVTNDLRMDEPSEEELEGKPIENHKFLFRIGEVEGDYFRIERKVLGLEFDLFLCRSLKLERRTFIAHRDISIFGRFNKFRLSEVRIGGEHPDALPGDIFEKMLKKFPNTTEVDHYARARISSIVRNYLPIEKDFQADYEKYLNKKLSRTSYEPLPVIAPYETQKFSDLIEKIEAMLGNSESYNEDQWQKEILQVVLLLFPRYIQAFPEAVVNDSWASKKRRVDFLLVDASGYIDVIEVKKPFAQKLVTPNCYRDNHVPMRELGGTIMQVEKYLYHFNRWGVTGEKKLIGKYGSKLPDDFKIKIVNPSGFIIMGRDNDLTKEQQDDFEVIRRKYRNVLDIITYDDLLRRLKAIRDQFQRVGGD